MHGVICSSKTPEDQEIRKKVFSSLSLDEAAVIAAVAPALIWLGAPAAIAAAVAPLIVKKFIVPAKEELCSAWEEAIVAQ